MVSIMLMELAHGAAVEELWGSYCASCDVQLSRVRWVHICTSCLLPTMTVLTVECTGLQVQGRFGGPLISCRCHEYASCRIWQRLQEMQQG